MKGKAFWRVLGTGMVAMAISLSALGQSPRQLRLSGVINDYTPANVGGPWVVGGNWSLTLRGESGTADFSAALTMVRSDLGVTDLNSPAARNAHTHHIRLRGAVTAIPNGFRVSGPATITGNGSYPPPFGGSSTLQIDVTGGNSVVLSNIKVTFSGDAASHFGSQPVNGVVEGPEDH